MAAITPLKSYLLCSKVLEFKNLQPIFCCYYSSNSSSNEGFQVPANVPELNLSSKNIAKFRKGAGGQASFSGNVVTVFGNSGFTGLRVVNRLAKLGNQLIIPYRSDPYWIKELKLVGELGQILFFPFELIDESSIRKAVKYSNVVVNLIGSYINTRNYSIYDTNVEGARRIARISREMGVERLVHVSAMNADPEHKSRYVKNGSFLKSKGLGELAVREEFPNATIVRPSVLYGEADTFIFKYLSYWRKMPVFGWVYVYKGGKGIYKMPTYVNDFSNGITRIAMDPAMAGKTFEFVGPHCYEMSELVDYIYRRGGLRDEICMDYHRFSYPDPWFWFAYGMNKLNIKLFKSTNTRINGEWLDFVEATSDVLSGGHTLGYKDLGIQPAEFEHMGGWYCQHYSFALPLDVDYNEIPDPPLPLRVPPIYKQKPKLYQPSDIKTESRTFGLSI